MQEIIITCQVIRLPHNSTDHDGSANIDLICIAVQSAKRLGNVIWQATRGC